MQHFLRGTAFDEIYGVHEGVLEDHGDLTAVGQDVWPRPQRRNRIPWSKPAPAAWAPRANAPNRGASKGYAAITSSGGKGTPDLSACSMGAWRRSQDLAIPPPTATRAGSTAMTTLTRC